MYDTHRHFIFCLYITDDVTAIPIKIMVQEPSRNQYCYEIDIIH